MKNKLFHPVLFLIVGSSLAQAGVGDPQIRTDHPWYPGELACSTFERLFTTQAEVFQRVTGSRPVTEEQKALAAWLWRNTHYYHGEDGVEDLWGKGFTKGPDRRTRDYWTGMFAHGFGLCGTTHSQWIAEMEVLLGHSRGRGVGVDGHNSFEAFLTGGPYGQGKWVLLDHDVSTVIYNQEGNALLSIRDIYKDWKRWTSRKYLPDRQPWLVCGLHPSDGGSYARYDVAEYLAGYSSVPPMVHLRRGETLRRYFQPGLADGKTFVFWGRNYHTAGIPGPERSHTWVNQPERMYRSRDGTGYKPGQARYANAVYTYKPNFSTTDYRDGVIEESDKKIAFEFYTPYIIAATPASAKPWGIYEPGCRNGLVLRGQTKCAVSLSTDRGQTWHDCGPFTDGMDLTELVKGRRQYFLRLHAGAKELAGSDLTMITVCQANAAILPRLQDNGTKVTFQASGQAVVSAGPNLDQAQAHVVAGKFGSSQVTMELATPRREPVTAIYAAAHVHSNSPPRPDIKYQIDYSTDSGKTWQPLVKDWTIPRRGDEPKDFWSQSCCWGSSDIAAKELSKVQVRFSNTGKKVYARCEVHLVYRPNRLDATRVTYAWVDAGGPQQASQVLATAGQWHIPTGKNTRTQWVEFAPVPK